MNRLKKPSPPQSSEKKSTRSIKQEACKETMASKYLSLVDRNENLTRLMKKFICDPSAKMQSVCQSYFYHSHLANHRFQGIRSQISRPAANPSQEQPQQRLPAPEEQVHRPRQAPQEEAQALLQARLPELRGHLFGQAAQEEVQVDRAPHHPETPAP